MIAIHSPSATLGRLLTGAGVAVAILLTSACASVDRNDSPETPLAPMTLEAWEARGKAAITLRNETDTVRFVWKRFDGQTETITFSGPLALNRHTIKRQGSALYHADGNALEPLAENDEAPALLAALDRLPPEALGNWLLGYGPNDGNWTVDVIEWQYTPPWRTPARVTIKGSGIDIKVMISQWAFNPPPRAQ